MKKNNNLCNFFYIFAVKFIKIHTKIKIKK